MGLHRGKAHLEGFLTVPGCVIGTVCDVDRRAAAEAADWVEKKTGRRPKEVSDFRRMLDDRSLDAISIAAPNHWHAPATILACDAGKHVYVEKPGSHNAQEAQWMVAAARKHQRLVQMGNQRRSWTLVREAMAELHGGIIGKLHGARSWYNADRTTIGLVCMVPTSRAPAAKCSCAVADSEARTRRWSSAVSAYAIDVSPRRFTRTRPLERVRSAPSRVRPISTPSWLNDDIKLRCD
jgi:hypothetical protein